MKIRITKPGYEHLNGMFGAVEFKNGVSVDHVSQREADQIAAVISVEVVEGDASKLIGNRYEASKGNQAEVKEPLPTGEPEKGNQEPKEVEYPREKLEQIADKEGIAGLRVIGEQFGVRSKSINSLIEGIVQAQR